MERMQSLFARKSIQQVQSEASGEGRNLGLRRALGVWNLIALGVGATIGAGIFVITGTAAARNAGPAIVLSFLLAGLGCALAGLCYAEFAALIPVAGSAYTYAYATLGEIFAWMIGWDLVLEYAFSTATVASGFSANLSGLLGEFGIRLPAFLSAAPNDGTAGALFNLPAALAVLAITGILILGVKESANFNFVMVLLKVATVLYFCGAAAWFLFGHPEVAIKNWSPFVPENRGEFGQFGWSGVLRGAGVIFFAYIGFDSVSTAAQESVRPQRDMPAAILGSLAICSVLYMVTAATLTGIMPYGELDTGSPVADGMDRTGLRFGGVLVRLGTLFGLTTTMLVTMLGQSRVFFAMARDGLLPELLGRVHPRTRTPHISLLIVGVTVSLLAGLFPLPGLGQMVSIGTLLAFAIVSAAVIVLRRRRPDLPRPFRVPLYPWIPAGGAAASLALMAGLPAVTWMRLMGWLGVGLVIYILYGSRRSRVRESAQERIPAAPAARG
jgi:APA family basic amino acid/polyamine antiporter